MKIEKLCPAYQNYLWGGNKLKSDYHKKTDLTPCAESWELSCHQAGLTRLQSGEALCDVLSPEALGENAEGFPFFPVLVKLIDAMQDLSVQVHPSDAYALANENSFGKTEMWYIVEAEPGACIYLGLAKDVSEEELRAAIAEERLTELLNRYEVKAGECYFIPAGTLHAIGRGCLICEIQQNSNLTYRVYDYGRRDKNGNPRELHIDKALAVIDRAGRQYQPAMGPALGDSKYFSVQKLLVNGTLQLTPTRSFQSLTCVVGCGKVNGIDAVAGDSFFIPADHGSYILEGNMEVILTEIRKYFVGIDLGGTFIKGGIVDDTGRVLVQDQIPTEADKGADTVVANIVKLARMLMESANMSADDITGLGMGVPGMIDAEAGCVIYSNNLGWQDLALSSAVSEALGLPVRIANDANVAALGETKFGAGKHYDNTVMITLGTGVGSGIVANGRLLEGNRSAGAEIGHTVIAMGGEQCTCGRRGCFEAYASATALIRDTKRAMEQYPESRMWEIGSTDAVTGKTAFDYRSCDDTAKAVTDAYIEALAAGIVNVANALRPEAVILGGGVCNQGEALLAPLRALVNKEIYAGDKGPQVEIVVAERGNGAGLLGAAALWM